MDDDDDYIDVDEDVDDDDYDTLKGYKHVADFEDDYDDGTNTNNNNSNNNNNNSNTNNNNINNNINNNNKNINDNNDDDDGDDDVDVDVLIDDEDEYEDTVAQDYKHVKTFEDLCLTNIQFLEGKLNSTYYSYGGRDKSIVAFVPLLANINRAGFYTIDVQTPSKAHNPTEEYEERRSYVRGFLQPTQAKRTIERLRASSAVCCTSSTRRLQEDFVSTLPGEIGSRFCVCKGSKSGMEFIMLDNRPMFEEHLAGEKFGEVDNVLKDCYFVQVVSKTFGEYNVFQTLYSALTEL